MIIKLVPKPCQCKTPPAEEYGPGTEWACDRCGRVAILEESQFDGLSWVWTSIYSKVPKR